MFSLVQNITSALKPLETEAVDARLDKQPKKPRVTEDEHSERHDDNDSTMGTDIGEYSILSVKSIILFLEDFLELRLSSALSDHSQSGEQLSFAPWFSKHQSNDLSGSLRSQKAIKAYAHAAETVRKIDKRERRGQEATQDEAQMKNIYALIRDLRVLQEGGTGYLKINSRKTFLDGIALAVELAKVAQD